MISETFAKPKRDCHIKKADSRCQFHLNKCLMKQFNRNMFGEFFFESKIIHLI